MKRSRHLLVIVSEALTTYSLGVIISLDALCSLLSIIVLNNYDHPSTKFMEAGNGSKFGYKSGSI